MDELAFESFWETFSGAKNAAVFTGAGASTLSGIRDFRGKDGVYSKPWQGHDVETILSLSFFRKDPAIFYAWSKEFCYCLDRFKPCIVHTVLAELENQGMIGGVMTQNIDVLHQAAGSKRVLEVHGSPSNHHCLKCRKTFGYEDIAPIVMRDEVPHCDCGGVIKPDIIFYGEQLDEDTLEACFNWAEHCDLMIVLGSSLTVQPAASIPLAAWQNGANCASSTHSQRRSTALPHSISTTSGRFAKQSKRNFTKTHHDPHDTAPSSGAFFVARTGNKCAASPFLSRQKKQTPNTDKRRQL